MVAANGRNTRHTFLMSREVDVNGLGRGLHSIESTPALVGAMSKMLYNTECGVEVLQTTATDRGLDKISLCRMDVVDSKFV